MDDAEWDYIILRGAIATVDVDPDDPICPDLDAIANGNGTTAEKVDRLADELAESVRKRRRPA